MAAPKATRKVLTPEKMNKFYEAFWWLHDHEMFQHYRYNNFSFFPDDLDIQTQKVNPETGSIDDDENLNTKVEVWIEVHTRTPFEKCGLSKDSRKLIRKEWKHDGVPCHDYLLDCGGDTFEEAIIKLASIVKLRDEGHPDYLYKDGPLVVVKKVKKLFRAFKKKL